MHSASMETAPFVGASMDMWRELRGRDLALRARTGIRQCGARWTVPSATSGQSYIVDVIHGSCTCPDHETRRVKCKHVHACEYVLLWSQTEEPDGSVTQTVLMQRRTYPQPSWSAYHSAQASEKTTVQDILRTLCDGIETQPHTGPGRKRIPLGDVIYGMAMKVYGGMSVRRTSSEINACVETGHLSRAAHYNSYVNYFNKPELTPILMSLVEQSASPLVAVESQFAVDSTGFSTSVYRRWFDHKYGREVSEQKWVKCHAMIGVLSNVITAVRVTEQNANDCPELPALLATTAHRFDVKELSADKGYLSRANVQAIADAGAIPFIPMKSNSLQGKGPAAWRKMIATFLYNQEEWAPHYHKRSNVESTFSALKRKFGGSVRSKTFTAQVNEVLLKCLCFNLTILAHAIHEMGIAPTFTTPEVQ